MYSRVQYWEGAVEKRYNNDNTNRVIGGRKADGGKVMKSTRVKVGKINKVPQVNNVFREEEQGIGLRGGGCFVAKTLSVFQTYCGYSVSSFIVSFNK